MKRINLPLFTIATALAIVIALPLSAHAQGAADVYKAKCVACHAADGSGSPMGKKMGAQDLASPEVQKMSDADLADAITNGKNKMPKYPAVDAKALVAYIRTLKK